MRKKPSQFTLEVESTAGRCPIGENIFGIDGVPEEERNETARGVADWVLESMKTA